MALFNKLFSTTKKRSTNSSAQKSTPGESAFTADQVRVILFRECDIRGRKLLFDSGAIEKMTDASPETESITAAISTSSTQNHRIIPQCGKCDHCKLLFQHHTNPKNDIKSLAEMIFGSAPIAFQGSSLKVHWLQSPKTIMYSHVFPMPVRHATNSSSNSSKKMSNSTYLGSELPGNGQSGFYYEKHPSGSDLSSIDTTSLRSFTVTSSTSTQYDISNNHRQRPPLPIEFAHFDRLADPRHSTNSGLDSGYGGTDPWTFSSNQSRHPLSSHRSSLASICSDYECFRRLSVDTNIDIPQPLNCTSLDNCSQFGSFHRRVSKNLSTSFENRLTLADHVGHVDELNPNLSVNTNSQVTASDGCVGNRNRRNSETMELTRRKAFSGDVLSTSTNYHGRPFSKKARLGIALCVQLNEGMPQDIEAFCSEHMSIFESMLCRLRMAAENACYRWPQFLQIMLSAWHSTQECLIDFFTAPKLINPVWITLSSGASKVGVHSGTYPNRSALTIANNFMNDLCSLLSLADTKDTNLFISTLLTAVLTHHLGWVSTISPGSSSVDEVSGSSSTIQQEKKKLYEITANHPYNVLWAQLSDLYGAVGHPVKLSRTIICGSPQLSSTMEKILNVLSYFIRCSEIKRTVHVEAFDEGKVKQAFNAQKIVNNYNDSMKGLPENSCREGNGEQKSPRFMRTESGMIRSATRTKDLTSMAGNAASPAESELAKLLKKTVMNDIPNVLVYRDSRFVQQELRIGNKSMDTEMVMDANQKQFLEVIYHIKKEVDGSQIKMTLTQPDETGQEAIELDVNDKDDVESVRLSRLITDTNIGEGEHSQRIFWGLERIKEGFSMEQLKYIDGLRGDYGVLMQNKPKEDVVFVLGDNEQLVNIKHTKSTTGAGKPVELGAVGGKKPCSHSKLRKHSVIFNFDRYPKVVENYLKSQNLDFAEYDMLEKGVKLEMALKPNLESESAPLPDSTEEECDVCRNTSLFYLQTPTNASELEFSNELNEESSYYGSFNESTSKTSLEEELRKYPRFQMNDNIPRMYSTTMATLEENCELKAKHPDSILKLVEIPMSKTTSITSLNDENNNDKTDKLGKSVLKAGFIPSLFSRVTDHYIPDMILQGTTALPIKWEKALKKDLGFAAKFAIMEPYPIENLAVVANLEMHEVRIVSSHTASSLSPSNSDGDVVGMSQLVSSMLETVHAMWSSGLSAFQCMAYIESKMREFYLQSETIASFLLATDFCTIGSITSALDITANDMPLLLSVASIHAPEVTRRYGIQFR
ncbi:folliculin-interacting protein 2 [Malaya genurostris]|uniref:folliculin-interacting protein 2 n=1 Tax=Malaya genurostris TaxID=325434 RepID=UPI0026F3ECEC|nr:folliculin-interacting protein 2 [Malaya genurostris]XP_058458514.1 folliculin-interacting protein 2 [Malaya genurostris]XP_058458515.1 folliculin-interacting protein 2 [Malaya genurostris]XP_058458516.1 folliculin-interacting protein 2 [Malaya genurostris]XP_058458517.1 folliculin-interacting protein 2 [Malaya genurostris]XP_058458518.1 folliculin-interacting protein 2 [Malaya genurostris]XP_058458519.1 folliculin-interacting protein 2 [Malaya genurostris]XP_058458520.1 folliculin-intera